LGIPACSDTEDVEEPAAAELFGRVGEEMMRTGRSPSLRGGLGRVGGSRTVRVS
jgi:hypothetical protein